MNLDDYLQRHIESTGVTPGPSDAMANLVMLLAFVGFVGVVVWATGW